MQRIFIHQMVDRTWPGLLALLAMSVGSGCQLVPVARRAVETATEVRGHTLGSGAVDESYSRDLLRNTAQRAQKDVGPVKDVGLVVAEPSADNVTSDTLAFGTGCTRWLHLHTSGRGELNRTPLWGQVADARDLLPRSDLRLKSTDATRFARLVGISHVALGRISGTGVRTTLSYQLYRTQPKLQPVGAPVVASGTRQQILQKLPLMARTLAASLGVQSPRVPAPQIAPDDFMVLGQVPWKANQPVNTALVARLVSLSNQEPLAGVLFLRSGNPRASKAQLSQVLSQLMKNAAGNTIAVADVARFYMADITPQRKVVTALQARYPRNYLALTSTMQLHGNAGNWALAQRAAEDAVRAAPHNALAWLDLSAVLGHSAESVRQGKYARQMNARERSTVYKLYPQQLSATWRATQLTPEDSYAWSEVAEAATFNGNSVLADKALWKALALDKSNADAYSWGLQMYQPKWGGNHKKLLQIARLAVQHADPDEFPARNLVDAIFHGGLEAQREELLTAALRCSPKNAIINYEFGAIQHYDKRLYRLAEKHYRIALAADPKYARALGSLGDLYFFVKRDTTGARQLYQQAVANDPGDASLRDKLKRLNEATASS